MAETANFHHHYFNIYTKQRFFPLGLLYTFIMEYRQ